MNGAPDRAAEGPLNEPLMLKLVWNSPCHMLNEYFPNLDVRQVLVNTERSEANSLIKTENPSNVKVFNSVVLHDPEKNCPFFKFRGFFVY
jgi:hypothetical protein